MIEEQLKQTRARLDVCEKSVAELRLIDQE
jgi:hypothetical protein